MPFRETSSSSVVPALLSCLRDLRVSQVARLKAEVERLKAACQGGSLSVELGVARRGEALNAPVNQTWMPECLPCS